MHCPQLVSVFSCFILQIGKQFSSDPKVELDYERGKFLLKTLGLQVRVHARSMHAMCDSCSLYTTYILDVGLVCCGPLQPMHLFTG